MRKLQIGKYVVEMYDSIEDLPISRFHKFNKMIMIDSGLGSDMSSFDSHIERAIKFSRTNPEFTAQELDNLRQNVYMIQSELSPKMLAFCTLVKAIDGKECMDISDDALKELQNKFSDLTVKEMTAQVDAVKKKIDEELKLYYPSQFDDDSSIKEYFDQIRKRTLLMLDSIIEGKNNESEIENITTALITHSKPLVFQGAKSVEVQHDKQFEEMCLLLSHQLHVNPKQYTTLEFYSAFEYVKKMLKAKNKK